MKYDSLKERAKLFSELIKSNLHSPVKIISNKTVDGIISSSIFARAFMKMNINFSFSTSREFSKNLVNELDKDPSKTFLFLDFNNFDFSLIDSIKNKNYFFITSTANFLEKENVLNLNNTNVSINEITTSGLAYLVARNFDVNNKSLSFLVIASAFSKGQEINGFSQFNQELLQESIIQKAIEVKASLRLFSSRVIPLHKMLQYSIDPYIPNISGSEDASIKFLKDCDISLNKDGSFRNLMDLSEDEIKNLLTNISLKQLGSGKEEKYLVGPIYLLINEEYKELKELSEFVSALKACIRNEKPSNAFALCVSDKKGIRREVIEILKEFRLKIINGLNWFNTNKKSGSVIIKNNVVLINTENNIEEDVLDIFSTIIAKSSIYEKSLIIGMSFTKTNELSIYIPSYGANAKKFLSSFDSLNLNFDDYGCSLVLNAEKYEEFINTVLTNSEMFKVEEITE